LSQHPDFPGAILIPNAIVEGFNRRVVRAGEDDCWPYWYLPRDYDDRGSDTASLRVDPARRFQVSWIDRPHRFKLVIPAHRLVLLQDIGPIPCGLLAYHLCSMPSCMNPRHLYAGTYQQNADDQRFKEEIKRRTGITSAVLPRHPVDGLRSMLVCEEFISELKAQRMQARLAPQSGSLSSAKLSTEGGSLPSPRPRPARGAAQAVV
jgi:hypothetical protein